MSDGLQTTVLVAATLSMGLMAGIFSQYSNSIMPALRRTDDRTFVTAFQQLDKAIVNPLFLLAGFLGALLLSGAALLLHLGSDDRDQLPWLAVAFALYLVVVIITGGVNVPRNNEIKAAGDPDQITDLAEVRRRFDEAKWQRYNTIRAVLTTVAFGLIVWALHLG